MTIQNGQKPSFFYQEEAADTEGENKELVLKREQGSDQQVCERYQTKQTGVLSSPVLWRLYGNNTGAMNIVH